MGFDRVFALSDAVATWAARVGGYAILASAVLVSADVILRKAFDLSFGGADELSGYAFAIGTTWAFSYALFRCAHIRIDVVYRALPRPVRAWLDVVGLLALGLFAALLAYHGGKVLQQTLLLGATANTPLRTPLWIPQTVWLLGLAWFVYTIALVLARSCWGLARRDYDLVRELAGAEEAGGGELGADVPGTGAPSPAGRPR